MKITGKKLTCFFTLGFKQKMTLSIKILIKEKS